MKKKSIRYAIASVICVALSVLFSFTINLVEVGTFIHTLNILGIIFSLAFAIIFLFAAEVYVLLTLMMESKQEKYGEKELSKRQRKHTIQCR
jgi:ABC-type Na+ efflux pump permease subunit